MWMKAGMKKTRASGKTKHMILLCQVLPMTQASLSPPIFCPPLRLSPPPSLLPPLPSLLPLPLLLLPPPPWLLPPPSSLLLPLPSLLPLPLLLLPPPPWLLPPPSSLLLPLPSLLPPPPCPACCLLHLGCCLLHLGCCLLCQPAAPPPAATSAQPAAPSTLAAASSAQPAASSTLAAASSTPGASASPDESVVCKYLVICLKLTLVKKKTSRNIYICFFVSLNHPHNVAQFCIFFPGFG